jgi:hypothetical protein
MNRLSVFILIFTALLLLSAGSASAQTTAFSYQGRLTDASIPPNGSYSMQFALFAAPSGGSAIATQAHPNVTVTNGIFTVALDLGNNFDGTDRYLEITVGSTILTPRQQIRSTPYTIRSATAGNALNLGGTAASQYVQTTDPRLSDARNPLPGSGSYIQNTSGTSQEQSASFNISGTGQADIFTAKTQFNIGFDRVLSVRGFLNTTVGVNAAAAVSAASSNSMFGNAAGQNNIGDRNSFFGEGAGSSNTSGIGNSFFGQSAGNSNTTGGNNTIIGVGSDVGSPGLTNATAIGARAMVTQSNSLVLGGITGVDAGQDTNVGIGTTAPARRLHVANGSSGAASISTSEVLIEDDSSAFQHFLTPNDIESGILFGDVTDSVAGGIVFNNSATNNGIQFRAGGNTTRMTLTGVGFLGIGTGAPADMLDVNGDIRVGSGTTGCVKDSDGTVLAGTCSSDARFKNTITSFSATLEKLSLLRPVHFYWNTKEFPERSFGQSQSFGLVAQEVNEVMPELVTTDDQGFGAVRYGKLPLLLLQGIKELKSENDGLKQRLREETDTNKQQQGQIDALKKLVCSQNAQAEVCKGN